MEKKEIKTMRDDELGGQLKTLRTRLFELRQQGVTGKVEDVSQLGKTRKDIARVLTEQRTRAIKKA
jgi:ribosomal protein L29